MIVITTTTRMGEMNLKSPCMPARTYFPMKIFEVRNHALFFGMANSQLTPIDTHIVTRPHVNGEFICTIIIFDFIVMAKEALFKSSAYTTL